MTPGRCPRSCRRKAQSTSRHGPFLSRTAKNGNTKHRRTRRTLIKPVTSPTDHRVVRARMSCCILPRPGTCQPVRSWRTRAFDDHPLLATVAGAPDRRRVARLKTGVNRRPARRFTFEVEPITHGPGRWSAGARLGLSDNRPRRLRAKTGHAGRTTRAPFEKTCNFPCMFHLVRFMLPCASGGN